MSACATFGDFSVEVSGTGRPMIFLPELACSARMWDQAVAYFREHFECHVIFPAGYADSGQGEHYDTPLSSLQRGLYDYIRTKSLDQPIVVGHGIGAFVALWLACTRPETVGGLILVESFPFYPGAGTNQSMT